MNDWGMYLLNVSGGVNSGGVAGTGTVAGGQQRQRES